MACCLMSPNHYLNNYWLILSKILWHSPESNFSWKAQEIFRSHEFENYWFKIISVASSGHQCINSPQGRFITRSRWRAKGTSCQFLWGKTLKLWEFTASWCKQVSLTQVKHYHPQDRTSFCKKFYGWFLLKLSIAWCMSHIKWTPGASLFTFIN